MSAVGGVAAVAMVAAANPAAAAQAQVGLGTATSYAVLAGTTVTNTGPSTISGDVGVSPGSATPGLTAGMVSNGAIHTADAHALSAQNDLTTAYNDARGRLPEVDKTGQDLTGQTLVPGVYDASTSMALTGTLTLDAQGDPDAVFVFQAGSTLVTGVGSRVALTGGAQACRVFWQVGSSATLGVDSTFVGSVLALSDITLGTRAVVQGRVLARNGQVALDTNTITRPACAASTPSPDDEDDTDDGNNNGGGNGNGNGNGNGDGGGDGNGDGGGDGSGNGVGTPGSPVVPFGHPETGRMSDPVVSPWLVAGLVCLGGGAVAAVRGSRRARSGEHRA